MCALSEFESKQMAKSLHSVFESFYNYFCNKFLNIDILVNYGSNIQN